MASTISLQQAQAAVAAAPCGRTPAETVPLAQALARTLAAAVATDGPWPPTDRSAMDGFAVAAGPGLAAGSRLRVVGESLAGHPYAGAVGSGQAVRIMTGAVLPAGADAVVPVEQTSGFAGDTAEVRSEVRRGQNVRLRGSEAAAGQAMLAAGTRLRAAEIGVLAVLGRAVVPVHARPRVAILATGDEVVPVEQAPLPHQVRESNSWALAAQVEECGGAPLRLGVAPDAEAPLRALLARGLEQSDVLLTIGGVSKGTHDLVHDSLQALGVVQVFHGIELKPGKPTFFGQLRRQGSGGDRIVSVFGLPGNPASCFTVFDLLVRPLVLRLLGQPAAPGSAAARVGGALFKANSRLQATPARLQLAADGARAELLPPSPSGDPFALLGGDCYALLPPNARPGEVASVPIVGYGDGTRLR
jgi:molybdopterin molybdotransferase